MTIIVPQVTPIALTGFPLGGQDLPDIQPWTYRSGITAQAQLESMRCWIEQTLVPYLNLNFPGLVAEWQDQVTTLTNAVNTALDQQATTVNTDLTNQQNNVSQQIAQAIQDIANSSVTVTDPAMLAALQATSSQTLQWLDNRYNADAVSDVNIKNVIDVANGVTVGYLSTLYGDKAFSDQQKVYYAPPPSGGDDTAVLQNLLNAAQSTNGTLILQHGEYKANLATSAAFQQPIIQGQGRYMTKLTAATAASPAVVFVGGSGSLAGGGLRSLGLYPATAGSGVALEYRGCGGVDSRDVHIDAFAEGVRFNNQDAGSFTEFCTFQGDIVSATLPVHYMKVNGNESFHGSGLVGNTVITGTYGNIAIQVDDGCFPYNAPLTATIFTSNASQVLIKNLNGNRIANFHGQLTHEGAASYLGDTSSAAMIALAGTVQSLSGASGGNRLGLLYLVDKTYFNGSNIQLQYKPFSKVVPVAGGTTKVTTEAIGTVLIQLDLVGPNYHYAYWLHCWQSPYDDTGKVTILATPETLNNAGYGAPTFAWTARGLQVTNANYPANTVKAYVTVIPVENIVTDDRFGQ